MLIQLLLISTALASQLSQKHLEKLLSHQTENGARPRRSVSQQAPQQQLSVEHETATIEMEHVPFVATPENIGIKIDFPNGAAPIPILVDTHGNPLSLPPFIVWASENAQLMLTNGAPVDAARLTRGSGNTQVDPENVSILTIVPEMYTPNPTYGDDATGAACTELANVTKKEYKIPDCMPWNIYDGKILFRLSSYEYSRSRAHQACQAMGGYLAVPQSERDHDYINLFLDRALGDPKVLINNGGGVGFESWIGVGVKLTTVGLVQQLTWEAQQCAFFHLCEGFKNVATSGLWDDCDTPTQQDLADCPAPDDYVWTGVPPNDEAAPFCAVYTPAKDTFALLNEFEWFWQESNCDRQYPALCEIDLRETGCQAFGFGAIETPKWKHPDYDDCTVYEWCLNDDNGNPVIQMGTCAEGRVFDETLTKPRCVLKENVPHCDIDECATGVHECDPNAVCTNTIGSYECACIGNYLNYTVPAYDEIDSQGNTIGKYHYCEDLDECASESTYECVINSICVNKNGTYDCSCDEFFAEDGVDPDTGRPLACVDDDECLDPAACGPSTQCVNAAPGYHCPCAEGFYDSSHESMMDEVNRQTVFESNAAGSGDGSGDGAGGLRFVTWDLDYDIDYEFGERVRRSDGSGEASGDAGSGQGSSGDASGDASGEASGEGSADEPEPTIDPALFDHYTGNRTTDGYIPLDLDGNPLYGDLTTCEDVDECVLGLHDCDYDKVQTCYNTAPGYYCDCAFGTRLNNDTGICEDIDECFEATFVCDPNAYCVNDIMEAAVLAIQSAVTYSCACRPGLAVGAMNETLGYAPCSNINECDSDDPNVNLCGPNADCVDYTPSYNNETDEQEIPYQCQCQDGYVKDVNASADPKYADFAPHKEQFAIVCEDRDECGEKIQDGVDYSQIFCQANRADGCTNYDGWYVCHCSNGFVHNNGTGCGDRDECTGGFWDVTLCNGDNPTCEEASVATGQFSCIQCYNTIGSWYCGCNEGWEFIGAYTDNDTYHDNGTFHEPGDQLQPIPHPDCVEGDPDWPHGCGPTCLNWNECSQGTVDCALGWIYDETIASAHDDIVCVDTVGSAYCECPTGFYSADPAINVHPNGSDKNPPPAGLAAPAGSPDGSYDYKCYDVNECNYGACEDPNAICFNQVTTAPGVPGYQCDCEEGYTKVEVCIGGFYENGTAITAIDGPGNPDFNDGSDVTCVTICIDIDECENDDVCPQTATDSDTCENLDGDVICGCGYGYIMNSTNITTSYNDSAGTIREAIDYIECNDIDECAEEPGCHAVANCTNTDGGYYCTCPIGYHDTYGNGTLCEDKEECNEGLADCDPSEDGGVVCVNTIGSFTCTCKQGYIPDESNILPNMSANAYCTDIQECEEDVDVCIKDAHEDLTTYPDTICGGVPFSGDNPNMNDCDLKATCTNSPGSYSCECNYPYTVGDGLTLCASPNECVVGNHECLKADDLTTRYPGQDFLSDPVECVEEPYFYQCRCTAGFMPLPDGQTCETFDFTGYTPSEAAQYSGASPDPSATELWCDGFNYTTPEVPDQGIPETTHYYACVDIDECANSFLDHCSEEADCVNAAGSYLCECLDGYEGDGRTDGTGCSDIDECDTGTHNCQTDDTALCINQQGSFQCMCALGYCDISTLSDGTNCTDCDECADGTDFCDGLANCTNTVGSFDCECNAGYEGDGFAGNCDDIDECSRGSHNCDARAACGNTIGSFECFCMQGFQGGVNVSGTVDDPCQDTDECVGESHNCHGSAVCINNDGSFTCKCNAGFYGDGRDELVCDTGSVLGTPQFGETPSCCTDINECNADIAVCGVLADCYNTDGSYYCQCQEAGYVLDAAEFYCSDIDECDASSGVTINCDGTHGVCVNTPGTYTCKCETGYADTNGDGTLCDEIDECADVNLFVCQEHSLCVNGPWDANLGIGYSCACIEGFESFVIADQGEQCLDIDECDEVPSRCHEHASCDNNEGSYSCGCITGTVGDGVTACDDVDECADNTHTCHEHADCINEDFVATGLFHSCSDCHTGYQGDGFTCEDEVECNSGAHNCCTGPGCLCQNNDGSFDCACSTGFTGDGLDAGTQCTNVDECDDGTHNCDSDNNAYCTDKDGDFVCACGTGYTGDGVKVAEGGTSCVDNEECVYCAGGATPDPIKCPCGEQAICVETVGSYRCECGDGFISTGIECYDVNECSTTNHDCDTDADCVNNLGSFECYCHDGYVGTGRTGDCNDVNECDSNPCIANSDCTNAVGSYSCACSDGFESFQSQCVDIDECLKPETNDCPDNSHCVNIEPFYQCVCDAGYTETAPFVDAATYECTNEDECNPTVRTNPCQPNADCVDTVGSYECNCIDGYIESVDASTCNEDDECARTCPGDDCVCADNMECTNTPGSFECACLDHFEPAANAADGCVDVDECADGSHTCPTNGVCVNQPGAEFTCECAVGYTYIAAENRCDDNDECAPCLSTPRDNGNCPCDNNDVNNVNGVCINTDGSFECWCPLGWWMKEDECVDIDECSAPEFLAAQGYTDNAAAANDTGHFMDRRRRRDLFSDNFMVRDDGEACPPSQNCVNSEWGYSCECADGWEQDIPMTIGLASGDGSGDDTAAAASDEPITCLDIDECSPDLGLCPVLGATCTNTPGNFTCVCNNGFNTVMKIEDFKESNIIDSCTDVDECTESPDLCGANTLCSNNFGGFACECLSGFFAPSGTIGPDGCEDADECTLGTHLCEQGGFPLTCINTPGGYECEVDPTTFQDGDIKEIWSWFFELADDMSNRTTPGNGTWPADQMNSTHYLNGTEVPTQAPFITNGTEGADPNGGDEPFQPFGTDPSDDDEGDNGLVEVAGDPHIMVASKGQTPVCFDLVASDHRFVDLLSDEKNGLEINGELHTLESTSRIITLGLRYEVQGDDENETKQNVYRIMMDEHGISIWMNDIPLHEIHYGTHIDNLDVGEQMEVVVSMGAGKKPGAYITMIGVATVHFTFKDRGHKKEDFGEFITENHAMGMKMINSDGISHRVKGILGQFMIPHAYETKKTNDQEFVVFHNRHVPAERRKYHAEQTCMEVANLMVPTLLGAPIANYEVESLFSRADTSRMEDQFIRMITSPEFMSHGPQIWSLDQMK